MLDLSSRRQCRPQNPSPSGSQGPGVATAMVEAYHGHMTTTQPHQPTLAWCPTCRTRREVMDTYATDTGDSRPSFTAYVAQPLECGHDAGDGGGGTPRPATRQDPDLLARLVALQEQRAEEVAKAQALPAGPPSIRNAATWGALAISLAVQA